MSGLDSVSAIYWFSFTALFNFDVAWCHLWYVFLRVYVSWRPFCLSDGGSVDTSSDWNAPSEAWGNYEEPTLEPPPAQEQPLPEPAKVNLLIGVAVSVAKLWTKISIIEVLKITTH